MNIARKYASAFSHLLSTQAALKQLLPSGATSHQFVRQASKFRAALLKEFGKPLVIEEQKRPKLKKDQVRLRVYCCGINSVDFHNAAGSIEPKPELPFVPGFEVYFGQCPLLHENRIIGSCIYVFHCIVFITTWIARYAAKF